MYIIIITVHSQAKNSSSSPPWTQQCVLLRHLIEIFDCFRVSRKLQTWIIYAAAHINALMYTEWMKYEEHLCDAAVPIGFFSSTPSPE